MLHPDRLWVNSRLLPGEMNTPPVREAILADLAVPDEGIARKQGHGTEGQGPQGLFEQRSDEGVHKAAHRLAKILGNSQILRRPISKRTRDLELRLDFVA